MNPDSVVTAIGTEVRSLIDKVLRRAITLLEGSFPPMEEITRRAKRVVFPDGKVEWYWDSTLILRELGPQTDGAGKLCLRFEAPSAFLDEEK